MDLVAGYAAGVATLALILSIYNATVQRRPHIELIPEWHQGDPAFLETTGWWIDITVTNTGIAPTSIRSVSMEIEHAGLADQDMAFPSTVPALPTKLLQGELITLRSSPGTALHAAGDKRSRVRFCVVHSASKKTVTTEWMDAAKAFSK